VKETINEFEMIHLRKGIYEEMSLKGSGSSA
jgi:hypothetical protein